MSRCDSAGVFRIHLCPEGIFLYICVTLSLSLSLSFSLSALHRVCASSCVCAERASLYVHMRVVTVAEKM